MKCCTGRAPNVKRTKVMHRPGGVKRVACYRKRWWWWQQARKKDLTHKKRRLQFIINIGIFTLKEKEKLTGCISSGGGGGNRPGRKIWPIKKGGYNL